MCSSRRVACRAFESAQGTPARPSLKAVRTIVWSRSRICSSLTFIAVLRIAFLADFQRSGNPLEIACAAGAAMSVDGVCLLHLFRHYRLPVLWVTSASTTDRSPCLDLGTFNSLLAFWTASHWDLAQISFRFPWKKAMYGRSSRQSDIKAPFCQCITKLPALSGARLGILCGTIEVASL